MRIIPRRRRSRLPNFAVPPGARLTEWMDDAFAIDPLDVAAALGLSPVELADLIRGARPVDLAMANALEAFTGIGAGSWLRFEVGYAHDLSRLGLARPMPSSARAVADRSLAVEQIRAEQSHVGCDV